jgi:ABC-type phosphate/phosphonate transport system substrate-binding protein
MTAPAAVASLAMYPLPSLRAATDELWTSVRHHLGWGPDALEWSVLTPEVWHHPQLLVAQTCGWPLITELSASVAVVGTFDYAITGAEHGTYRSVLVTRHDTSFEELRARPGIVAAVNGFDSLSGWISLQHAWGGEPDAIETGGHLESVRALAAGRADLASIDAVSWALFGEDDPDLVAPLRVVGAGPRVPCLPLVTGVQHTSVVPALREAFAAAVVDAAAASACRALLIRGFVPLELTDYLSLPSLLG